MATGKACTVWVSLKRQPESKDDRTEDNCKQKTSSNRRHQQKEDILKRKTSANRTHPLTEDILKQKTSSHRRHPQKEETLKQKTSSNRKHPQIDDNLKVKKPQTEDFLYAFYHFSKYSLFSPALFQSAAAWLPWGWKILPVWQVPLPRLCLYLWEYARYVCA